MFVRKMFVPLYCLLTNDRCSGTESRCIFYAHIASIGGVSPRAFVVMAAQPPIKVSRQRVRGTPLFLFLKKSTHIMKNQSNNAATAANNSNNWKNEVNEIRARLEAVKTRSCWDRGVKGFALNLLRSYIDICEYCDNNGRPIPELNEKTLLNGADDWNAYCYGGGALIYDGDIAEALCTPSMLKKKDGGRLAPDSRRTWMDLQRAAYKQAYRLLMTCIC